MECNADRILRSLLSHRRSRLLYQELCQEGDVSRTETTQENTGSSHSHSFRVETDDLETIAPSAKLDSRHPPNSPSVWIAPSKIASEFAKEAACVLDTTEVDMLVQFLEAPKRICPNSTAVDARLEAFYQDEIALTQEPRHRLSSPSGPEHAEIGIILHCQSKEGEIGQFWDSESPTIRLLEDKGFTPDFTYGFDWHWRGEESVRRKGKTCCPATSWPQAKRSLHDTWSSNLLEILPLPWLVVGGACAKGSYRRMLPSRPRLLLLQLTPEVDIEFDIDIRETGVKRVTMYIPHPASAFFHPSHAAVYGAILDASLSFTLWLHGKQDASISFAHAHAKLRRGIPGAAPLKELYEYRKREDAVGRNLTLLEYDHCFRSWAKTFLLEQPEAILSSGGSLADAIVKKLGETISASLAARRLKGLHTLGLDKAGRKGTASRYGYTFKPFWEGQEVRVTQKGKFKIFLSEHQTSLELCGGAPLYKMVQRSPAPVTIHFVKDEILLKQGEDVLFQRSTDSIKDEIQRARWVSQVQSELDTNARAESAELAAGEHLLLLCAESEAQTVVGANT